MATYIYASGSCNPTVAVSSIEDFVSPDDAPIVVLLEETCEWGREVAEQLGFDTTEQLPDIQTGDMVIGDRTSGQVSHVTERGGTYFDIGSALIPIVPKETAEVPESPDTEVLPPSKPISVEAAPRKRRLVKKAPAKAKAEPQLEVEPSHEEPVPMKKAEISEKWVKPELTKIDIPSEAIKKALPTPAPKDLSEAEHLRALISIRLAAMTNTTQLWLILSQCYNVKSVSE